MGKEATSWEWLRDGITRSCPQGSLLERVENGVGAGMADVNYIIRGVEGWIELKAVDCPKRPGTAVLGLEKGLSLAQVNWHLARSKQNGRTWIFITAKPLRWLVPGMHARIVNLLSVEELCEKSRLWSGKNWDTMDWHRLVRVLGG